MAIPTSPSVVVIENDNSIYAPNVDSSVVGLVGFADKGPTDTATLITSQANLLNTFGRPDTNIPGQGLEGALEILEATNQVYFVRAAGTGALEASSVISLGYCPAVQLSSITATISSIPLYYSVTNKAGVVESSSVLTITSSTGVTATEDVILAALDKDVVKDSPIYAMKDSAGVVFIASRYAGSSVSLQLSSNGTAIAFSQINYNGSATTAGTNVTVSGGSCLTTGASAAYALAKSVYVGTGYNLSSLRDGTVVGVSVEVDNVSRQDILSVNSDGAQKEQFAVELSPSSEYSVTYVLNTDIDYNQSDLVNISLLSSGAAYTPKNNIADKSDTMVVSYGGTSYEATPRFVKMVEGTYGLANGDSGYSTTETGNSADYTALIGTQALKSGMYALDDDALNISLALVPGIPSQSVQNALITLAESSKNFVAVVAPPYGLDTVQEAVEWMNGKGHGRTAAINNSYAAVYWPWVQVFNYFAGADQWYDPAIFAARQYVYTDSVAEPWFAPAGYRRGRLTKPSNVEIILNQGDRDVLYSNNVNPVTKEGQTGIVILGQRTAQRLPSALNSVNVRRLMVFIRKVLLILGRPFQFEPNDEFTWELVEESINPFLDDLKQRRAIVEGSVKCDSTTNTPIRIDRKEMWVSITIKPTLAAETVVFEVNLTNQAATING